MAVTIRAAQQGDARGIATVHVASWQEGYAHIFDEAFLAALDVDERAARYTLGLDAPDLPFTQVAEDGGTIVGFVTTSTARDADLAGAGEIQALYVDPAHWRRGIGHQLLAAGIERLRTQGCSRASLWVLVENTNAKQLYVSNGWTADGSVRVEEPWGVVATVERLVRPLD